MREELARQHAHESELRENRGHMVKGGHSSGPVVPERSAAMAFMEQLPPGMAEAIERQKGVKQGTKAEAQAEKFPILTNAPRQGDFTKDLAAQRHGHNSSPPWQPRSCPPRGGAGHPRLEAPLRQRTAGRLAPAHSLPCLGPVVPPRTAHRSLLQCFLTPQVHRPESTHLPPTSHHLPPTTYHLPHHLPLTAYRLPPTTYHLPPATHHAPPTTYHLPLTTYHLPLTAYHLPLTAYRLPLTARSTTAPSASTSSTPSARAAKAGATG